MSNTFPPRISLPRLLLYFLSSAGLIAACGAAVVFSKRLVFGPGPVPAEGEPLPIASWLTYVAIALAVLIAYRLQARFVERRPRSELAPDGVRGLPVAAVVGIALTGLVVAILSLGGAYHGKWHGLGDLLAPTLMAIGAALSEEVLIRGFFLGLVERRVGSVAALVSSAILFGGLHFDNAGAGAWPVVALMLGPGFALGAAFLATRRLWWPLGLHFGWNFGQSALFGLIDSGTSFTSAVDATVAGPYWLTGGDFGPEASLPGFAVWVLVGLIFLGLARMRGLMPFRSSNNPVS